MRLGKATMDNDEIGQERNQEIARRDLIRGARGSLSEWRHAVDNAYRAGLSDGEIDWYLFRYHPMFYVLVVGVVIALIGVMCLLAGK